MGMGVAFGLLVGIGIGIDNIGMEWECSSVKKNPICNHVTLNVILTQCHLFVYFSSYAFSLFRV